MVEAPETKRRCVRTNGGRFKVLVAANTHPDGLALFAEASDVDYDVINPGIDAAGLSRQLRDGGYHALIAGNTPLTEEAIVGASQLCVVSRHGVGCDAINVDALTQRGIPLSE